MATTSTVLRLEGMEQTLRAMRRAPEVFKKHCASAVGFSSLRLTQRVREMAPQDTGLLKSEIDFDHKDGTLTGGVGLRSRAAFYWYFLEFGTVKISARPFFRPAMEEEQARFIREVADAGAAAESELDT